ncbi:ClbS/DfsB family four-helix bundle protein [Planctomycetota bacterium]|nr:ClbS/DfsB family four-helix bundle protein [Planctomycetota bacterium]
MPLAESKVELLVELAKAYGLLDGEFEGMREKDARRKGIEWKEGTMVSCCDVVAYQIGWGELLLSWEESEMRGEEVCMPCEGFKWNELGKLAEKFYKQKKGKSLKVLRKEWEAVYSKVRAWIESLDEEEVFEVGMREWTGEKWVMAKWVQVNTIGPWKSARTKVRKFKRECLG